MPEEEIKKLFKELTESEENKAFLKDLASFDEAYQYYQDIENDFILTDSNDGVLFIGDKKRVFSDMSKTEKNLMSQAEDLRKNYGPGLQKQFKIFFEGPEDTSDEAVSKWIKDSYLVVRLLACSRVLEADKEPNVSAMFLDLCSLADEMPAAVEMAKASMRRFDIDAFSDKSVQPISLDEYQDCIRKNFHDAKEAYSRPVDNTKINLTGVRIHLNESGNYYKDDKARFDTFADNLEKAKTLRNSDQYKNLIKMVRHLNETEKYIASDDGYSVTRTDKQNYCMKLFSIKGCIDEYLKHKAKDGVNKNTYDKLAAVEELNEYVSRKLEELKPDYNKRETMFGNGTKYTKCSYKAWQEEFEKVPAEQNIPDKQRNAANCMGRIISRAGKMNLSSGKIQDLKAMRNAFAGASVSNTQKVKNTGKTL